MAGKARFAGKSMVVTGAAQGIGRQVALEAAAGGARLALVDRSPLVQDVARIINSEYGQGQSIAIEADLETWAGNEEAMARADRTFGAIDILVANVGGAIWMKPFEKFDEKQLIAEINRSLYPTAVTALTASLSIEVGTKNIRVNAVAPGGTTAPPRAVPRGTDPLSEQDKVWIQQVVDQTVESSHMKRYGLLREMSAAILFLASDEASYITGTVLPVGGGDQG
jgi:dihydroxycyclohexadiene carboxylate dehydrogenase